MAGRLHELIHRALRHHDVFAADEAAWQQSWLAQADARLKLAFLCSAIVANLVSTAWFTSAVAVAISAVGLTLGQKRPLAGIALRLVPALFVVAPLVVIRGLMGPPPYVVEWDIGLFALHVSGPGVAASTLLAWKVAAGLSLVLLVVTTAPVPQVLEALRWYRVPEPAIEVASLMYRYFFVLAEEGERLSNAQRLRSRKGGLLRRAQELSTTIGSLLIRAYDRAERVQGAQVLRAGKGLRRRTFRGSLRWDHAGAAAAALFILASTVRL